MHDLMNVEMSRTEFLKLLGVGLMSMLGFGLLMSVVNRMRGGNSSSQQLSRADGNDHEFGTRKFGV